MAVCSTPEKSLKRPRLEESLNVSSIYIDCSDDDSHSEEIFPSMILEDTTAADTTAAEFFPCCDSDSSSSVQPQAK